MDFTATLKMHKQTALVISAGGPTAPLIAGALYAFYKAGVRFPIIYCSGGGALVALTLIAPKTGGTGFFGAPIRDTSTLDDGVEIRLNALDNIYKRLSVHSSIYGLLP